MTQTVKGSAVEALANIAVGFGINFLANWFILPLFGFASLTLLANFEIGMLYTLISLVRSYVLRRWFNGLKFGNAEPVVVPAALPVPMDTIPKHITSQMSATTFIANVVALLQQKDVAHIDSTWEVGLAHEHVRLRIQLLDGNRPGRLS